MSLAYFSAPIGLIEIKGSNSFITSVKFVEEDAISQPSAGSFLVESCRKQFIEYFEGKRKVFDIPVNPGGSEFQKNVWKAVQNIPYGATATYSSIAAEVGGLTMTRAVGSANGQNPLLILVPCHRVIGADGSLTGYAAGIDRKRWLLDHEKKVVSRQLQLL